MWPSVRFTLNLLAFLLLVVPLALATTVAVLMLGVSVGTSLFGS